MNFGYEAILGILLLLLGKKLFWLFVGIVGFVAGVEFAPRLFPDYPAPWVMAVSLALGVAGAALAIAFQGFAIMAAGFLGGGYLLMRFFPAATDMTLFVVGGIIGLVMTLVIFDWALIVLSSLVGAGLIVKSLAMTGPNQNTLLIVLAASGILIQSAIFYWLPDE